MDPSGWGFNSTPSEHLINPGQTNTGSLPSWLTVAPASGTVGQGLARNVTLTLNSAGMFGGTYPATVLVKSNDPAAPAAGTPLPIEFTVVGVRRLAATPTGIVFGNAWAGTRLTRRITLENTGSEATTLTSLSSNNAEFSAAATLPLTVQPFGTVGIDVDFAPANPGAETGSLTIGSNAADNPSITVSLSGVGTTPPSATLVPAGFTLALSPDQAPADRTATLSNVGGDLLSYRVVSVTQTGSPLPAASLASLPLINSSAVYAESNTPMPMLRGASSWPSSPGRKASPMRRRPLPPASGRCASWPARSIPRPAARPMTAAS